MFDNFLVILIRADDRDDEHFDGGSSYILFILGSPAYLFSYETNMFIPNLFLDHKLRMKIWMRAIMRPA